MFQALYEEVVRFGSEGELGEELKRARAEYVTRTGELFESDASFERRIAAFLEWYALDRPIAATPDETPLQRFLKVRGPAMSPDDQRRVGDMQKTVLSLFEFRRARTDHMVLVDLLTHEKISVYERRKPAGLASGDILEARVVPYDGKLLFSDAYCVHPREVRKAILKAAKRFKKAKVGSRLDLVHRVAYFTNRCERYRHVDPKQIFAELEAQAA